MIDRVAKVLLWCSGWLLGGFFINKLKKSCIFKSLFTFCRILHVHDHPAGENGVFDHLVKH